MTKEELLEKGISEEMADEIVAGFSSDSDEDNSLTALQKALDSDSGDMDSLFKADEGEKDEDDEGEDYDEKYMKKYMKRYMKENKKSCGKMAKEVGIFGDKMQKAIEDVDLDSEGAVVEMTDLAPFLESQSEFNQEMVKAISELAGSIDLITAKTEKSYDLMQKAARVQVEQANGLSEFLSVPQGRKGVVASADMKKASAPEGTKFSPEDNKVIYQALMKAVKSGDKMAGQVISVFESKGQNANYLKEPHKNFIHELIAKEAN